MVTLTTHAAPGGVAERTASNAVQEALPKLREVCQRALGTPAATEGQGG